MATIIQLAPRIGELDIIRGMALFGILMVNMGLFSFPALYMDAFGYWPGPSDKMIIMSINFIGEGKFISMFSFLFGLGFTIFIQRAEKKKGGPVRLFTRRLLVLLVIGLIHGYFIWYGDVLVVYSLAGMLLLFFRKSKPKTVLIWAFSILLVPVILFLTARIVTGPSFFEETTAGISQLAIAKQAMLIYRGGSVADIFLQNSMDLIITKTGYLLILPQIFAMFLFGTYAGKKQIFQQVREYLPLIRKVCLISLLIGGAIAIPGLFYIQGPHTGFGYTIMQIAGSYIGGSALGIFYICALILLLQKPIWQKMLAPFAAVGRMAATNYVLQSVFCVFIFYSFGLGQYGKTSPATGLLITIFLFISQMVISNLWMKFFPYGPLEWLWRKLTYVYF